MRNLRENDVKRPVESRFRISTGKQIFIFSVLLLTFFPRAAGAQEEAVVNVLQKTDGADGGTHRLLKNSEGFVFYETEKNSGIIGAKSVVLIKIDALWAERGGTNTDLLKSFIEAVINHPNGFSGEIVIADNGQAMFGSEGKGARLDWPSPNSKDQKQTVQDVIDYFSAFGVRISGICWDTITKKRTAEFSAGDMNDGYVVEPGVKSTGMRISYPKWTTPYGTKISFKSGIWEDGKYDSEKLRLINMPVLKTHAQYYVHGAQDSYMGVISDALTDMAAGKSAAAGGLGTLIAGTRLPALTVLDMIYICPERGPVSTYKSALKKDMIVCGTDLFAVDSWAVRNVLFPAAQAAGWPRAKQANPDSAEPGAYGARLLKSAEELRANGFNAVTDDAKIRVNYIN